MTLLDFLFCAACQCFAPPVIIATPEGETITLDAPEFGLYWDSRSPDEEPVFVPANDITVLSNPAD